MRRRLICAAAAKASAAKASPLPLQRVVADIFNVARRRAFRRREPLSDLSERERDLLDGIARFEAGLQRGDAVHDSRSASLLARACTVPHAAWESRERWRALWLFESTQQRRSGTGALDMGAGPPLFSWRCGR